MQWLLGKSTKKKYEPNIEFLSPLSLVKCVNALKALADESSQSTSLLSVSIERLDEMTLRFHLRKIYWTKEVLGRHDIYGNHRKQTRLRYEVLKSSGTLSEHVDKSTQVICHSFIAKQTYIPYIVLLILPLTIISIVVAYVFFSVVGIILGIAIFFFAISRFLELNSEFEADCGRLSNLVKQTLNG